ncbi:MAG TPA: ATP-binding protein [Candidatus Binataceae bacterium]|nr:ATP-binding protein [Candidatus Binataceae bacterium]
MDLWRDIVESLPQAVLVLSQTGDPITVNPAAETLLGVSPIVRFRVERLFELNQWLADMVKTCFETAQSLENPAIELALEKRRVSVHAGVFPLLGPVGEAQSVVVLLHDLSHQRGLELGGERNRHALRLSPAGLAHEVKNPLTGIKGAAELLAALFPADERARQYCGLILQGVDRIASLVEQVLAVSGPARLNRGRFNIHQVLHQALRMAGLFEPVQQGVVVEQLFDPSLPEVNGDAAALERVFLNLLRNAREAIDESPTGTRHLIRIRTAMESQFRISSKGRRRQFLRVEISDTGKGITGEEIEQLFTPFFTTKAKGTGLGLMLSQHTIELHGGKLWAESRGPENLLRSDSVRDPAQPADPVQPVGMTFHVLLPFD